MIRIPIQSRRRPVSHRELQDLLCWEGSDSNGKASSVEVEDQGAKAVNT